jgi:hypothetical protein
MLMIVLGGFITVALIGQFGGDVRLHDLVSGWSKSFYLPAFRLEQRGCNIAGQKNMGVGKSDRKLADFIRRAYCLGWRWHIYIDTHHVFFLSPVMMGLFVSESISGTGGSLLTD